MRSSDGPRSSTHPLALLFAVLAASAALALVTPAIAGNNIASNEPYQTWGQAKTGALDFRGANSDSVYSLDLKKGNDILITMSGSSGSDYDMYLFGPPAVSIFDSTEIAAGETSGTSSESIRYTATADGFHYLDVVTWDTTGTFSVNVKVTPVLTFSRASSQTVVDYARGTNPSAFILNGTIHPGVPENTLAAWQDPVGGSQRKIAKGFSSTGNGCSLTLAGDIGEKPYETSTYRVAFAGAPGYFSANSAWVKVPVRPSFASWSRITTSIAVETSSPAFLPKSVLLTGLLQTTKYLPAGEHVTLERSSSSSFPAGGTSTLSGSPALGTNGRFEYRFKSSLVSNKPGTYYIRPRYSGTSRWEGSLVRKEWYSNVKITVVD